VNLPVARASTVLFESLDALAETQKLFESGERIATYGIVNMPQRNAFEEGDDDRRPAVVVERHERRAGVVVAGVVRADHLARELGAELVDRNAGLGVRRHEILLGSWFSLG
jgi:hypothetical protein